MFCTNKTADNSVADAVMKKLDLSIYSASPCALHETRSTDKIPPARRNLSNQAELGK